MAHGLRKVSGADPFEVGRTGGHVTAASPRRPRYYRAASRELRGRNGEIGKRARFFPPPLGFHYVGACKYSPGAEGSRGRAPRTPSDEMRGKGGV